MKDIHNVWVTVFCKPEDEENLIVENLKKFFPFDLKEEKILIEHIVLEGTKSAFQGRNIIIFRVYLQKTKHINKFVNHLRAILNEEQKEMILRQKDSRLDFENHFFMRFDKDKLMKGGIFYITSNGNCYHIKMSIAAYPTTRENALKTVDRIFSENKI